MRSRKTEIYGGLRGCIQKVIHFMHKVIPRYPVESPVDKVDSQFLRQVFTAVSCGAVAALWFAPDYLTRERQEFKEEGHSFNPRTARKQGLAAYGQTAGVPSFLSPPRTRQFPTEFQRKTSCPDRVNRLCGSSAPVNQRKIMDNCRCSTNTTCRSTPNLLQ